MEHFPGEENSSSTESTHTDGSKETLLESINEHRIKIKSLKNHISDLNGLIACYQKEFLGPEATVLATNKIIELSKRNRHLTAELECSKAKCQNYNRKITKLQWDLQANFNENKRIPEPPPPTQSELDRLSVSLSESKVKISEILNSNASLKNELKLVHKCLQQEIGEPVNINSLLSVGSTWRGRAQIILGLQQKVTELKQKLDTPNVAVHQPPTKSPCFVHIENARKFAETEQQTKKISNLQQQLDDHKFKLGAMKSRNKTMCDEVSSCKLKMLDLIEKSKLDEKCIASLNLKIESLSWDYELKLKKMSEQLDIAKTEQSAIEVQKMQAMLKTENAVQELEDKENRIDELERDLRALAGDFLFSCRDMKKEQFLAMLEALEAQIEALLQQVVDGNNALSAERREHEKQDSLVARLKTRVAQLEKRLKEAEAENSKKIKPHNSRKSSSVQLSKPTSKNNITVPPNSSADIYVPTIADIEDLKYKLDFANEEILILKKRHSELHEEKDTIYKYFCGIILKSKEIFLKSFSDQKK